MSLALMKSVDCLDTELQHRVSEFLFSRNFPVFRRLTVSVAEGAVTLTGEVHSFYQKQVALTSCQQVPGLRVLFDQIDVCDRDLELPERELLAWSADCPENSPT